MISMLSRAFPFIAAMAAIVVASNVLVQYPFGHFGLEEVLTWGAFTYPIAFLINDLANRRFGPKTARGVVYCGFVAAVILSVMLATPRIALASGAAFLAAQLLDTQLFDRLRHGAWWRAPFLSTLAGSTLDTVLFFSVAFAPAFAWLDYLTGFEDNSLPFPASLFGLEMPLWASLAFGDFAVKIAIGIVMLAPYGALLAVLPMAGRTAEQR